ncbi:putative porin [Marinobacter hydrocarbonoclasticus]|nr:putative porin [Marinobacter nauticus]
MKPGKVCALVASMWFAGAAMAQDRFQHEASMALNLGDSEFVDLAYSYSFSPVAVGDAPYWLNRFLDPASFVNVGLLFDSDDNVALFGGRYQAESGWFVGVEYVRLDVGGSVNQFQLDGGYFFAPGQRVRLHYSERDTDFDLSSYGLDYRGYWGLDGISGIGFDAAWTRTDVANFELDQYTLSATAYLTQSWFAGLAYAYADLPVGSDDEVIVSTGYWWQFGRNLSAQAVVYHDDSLNGRIGLTARF